MQETQTLQTEKSPLFISLRVKLIAGFLLLFGIVFGASYYWFYTFSDELVTARFYHFTTNAAMDRLQEDLDILLRGVAPQINADDLEALMQEGQPNDAGYTDDPRYWEQAEILLQMRNTYDQARFYTYMAGDKPNTVTYGVSSGALLDPPQGVKFLKEETYSPADAAVILGGLKDTTYYLTIYQDEYGEWISGYTPIKNSAGETVGALGIDIKADYVRRVQADLKTSIQNDVQKDVQRGIILAAGITALVVIVLVYLISQALTRPVVKLTQYAALIGEGNYDQDLSNLTPDRTTDEIGKLAEVFEIMVGKVAKREEKLKQQVADLQIMIDESKRQEQVSEIVDTDFFRELQEKARVMRKDFSARSGESPSEA